MIGAATRGATPPEPSGGTPALFARVTAQIAALASAFQAITDEARRWEASGDRERFDLAFGVGEHSWLAEGLRSGRLLRLSPEGWRDGAGNLVERRGDDDG